MKTNKLEIKITYFIITTATFLLNFKNLSLLTLIFSFLLSLLFILLFEKTKIYKFNLTKYILLLLSIIFLTYYLNKTCYFISDNILREYSTIFISFTLLLSLFIIVNKGYHTIIKIILLSSYFIILFFILGIIINIPYIDISNLNNYILENNNLLLNSLFYSFLLILNYFLIYPVSNTKFKVKDFIFNSLYQIFLYLLIISILGNTLISLYGYPYIIIFKKVNLIGFIERIEIIFSMNYLFCFYYLLLLFFYQIKYILESKIKKDNKLIFIIIFLTILIFLTSISIF